jgi:Secretion system C-terminal sorting domain
MKQFIKYIILPVNILLFVVAFPQKLKAQQMTGTFIMSSVGGIQNASNNSMAIAFNSSATCLNVQNGTAVLTGDRGTGNFAINCEVNTVFNSLGIKLYPNPVGANTKVKFMNAPPLNDQFNITIWNSEGQQVGAAKATGFEIFQGKQIDFGSLSVGSYVIQIESEKYIDALKFIKAN